MPGTIGLFLRANDNNYQQQLKDLAVREAKCHGFEIIVQSAQNDASKQVAQIRAAIRVAPSNQLVAVLVSSVRDEELAPMVRETAEAGLAFALLNEGHFLDEIRDQCQDRALFVVTPDQVEIGRIQGRQVRALVGDRGKVLCVTGPMNTEMARQRLQGLREILADGFNIVELSADWTSERARMSVEHWLTTISEAEVPNMFVGHNDEMALGMRQALRDAASRRNLPLDNALMIGCDGLESFGQRLVREGRMTATVIMPPTSGAAIQWVAKIRSGQDYPPVRVVLPVTSFPDMRDLKAH